MEGYDIISDSYSAEIISVMIVERLWSKVRNYLDRKQMETKRSELYKRISEMEKAIAVNTAIDKRRDREKN